MTRTAEDEQQRNQASLNKAVRDGDADEVQRLLKLGANPEGRSGFPLLHHAIENGHSEIARLLVEAGANIERTSYDEWTPLTRADAEDQTEIAEYLISVGADESARHRHGFTPLHKAARNGDSERCSFLLRGGVDIEARAADGATALILASKICNGNTSASVIRTLLQHHADPDVAEDDGWSAIAFAAYEDASHANFDHAEVVRVPLLLAAGANPNLGSFPPILAAISQEGHNWDVIEFLLQSGADPDAVSEDGDNILLRAAAITSDAEFIVRCGTAVSNVNHLDRSGQSAIESLLDEFWDPADIDDAAKLLAFVALDADLSRVKDRLPDWLDLAEPIVRVRSTLKLEETLEHLRLLAAETRKSFRDRSSR
jgi:ankyrin repeat protein